MDTLLYQFPVSHYCEKARWSLDYKNVPYQTKNLLPGLHQLVLRGKVEDTTLPVLRVNGRYIQGSDCIIDFLDQAVSGNSLTPIDTAQGGETKHWETFASTELATPLSIFYYAHMLENPILFRKRSVQNGPWYAPFYYAITFNLVCNRIRDLYNIRQKSAEHARQRIKAGLQKLEQHLQSRSYLVGDQFTRADLSIAASLSSLAGTSPSSPNNASTTPDAIAEFRDELANLPVIQWVKWLYKTYRN